MPHSVMLAQCLCPQRHCILAAASETETADTMTHKLRAQIRHWLVSDVINPWCGLCGAPRETWTYEVGRTRYRTMAEAAPALRQMEAMQIRSRAVLHALGLTYDAAREECDDAR